MKLGSVVGRPPRTIQEDTSQVLIDSKTLLGVEIEVENVFKPLDYSDVSSGYWSEHADDSLRNSGKEYVFAEPLRGGDAVRAVEYLCKQAVKNKWVTSIRTGLHVHLDVRDLELEEARVFCTAYALTEKPIYNFIGDNRDKNLFCLPWFMAEGDLGRVADIWKSHKNITTAEMINKVKELHRYSGLNIASLAKFGTVEFRQMKTTFDHDRIIDWLNIILSIKKFSREYSGTAEDLIKDVKALGPRQFMERIYGKTLTGKMWYVGYLIDSIGTCCPVADYFLSNSKEKIRPLKISKDVAEDIVNAINLTLNNVQSSGGKDHPGLDKWKARRAKVGPTVASGSLGWSSLFAGSPPQVIIHNDITIDEMAISDDQDDFDQQDDNEEDLI